MAKFDPITKEESARLTLESIPKEGETVLIKLQPGKLVEATYRKWITGTPFSEVEYDGQILKKEIFNPPLGEHSKPERIDLVALYDELTALEGIPIGVQLSEFVRPPEQDENELLQRRFLCRGGGLLFVGPTGIGKSAFAMQAMIQWAIGLPAFGIEPAWKLKSLLIQAENDDGDIAEFRDGVLRGLELTPEQAREATQNVIVCTNDSTSGSRFFKRVVRPLLEEHRPELLVIDPALAYLGGETNSQRDVGSFLRNELNPLLRACYALSAAEYGNYSCTF